MKVFVVGLRGFPNILGGIESHCENLYPLMADDTLDIRVARRKPYVTDSSESVPGIEFVDIWSPKSSRLETIVHTFIAVFHAYVWRADIVHIHAIGPGLLAPLARILGMRVVITHHGADYERQKWGRFAKTLLRAGEYHGCRWANQCIAISRHIQNHIAEKVGAASELIPNGAKSAQIQPPSNYLAGLGLQPKGYLLCVARFVPEKGLHDLIAAHKQSENSLPLVIAGDADHDSEYCRSIKAEAEASDDIILTGFISGSELAEVFSNAKVFVLPSYHEGLPIALLEAMSFGLDPLVSDIPAHTEVALAPNCYFPVGNIEQLAAELQRKSTQAEPDMSATTLMQRIETDFSWDVAAQKTREVYQRLKRS